MKHFLCIVTGLFVITSCKSFNPDAALDDGYYELKLKGSELESRFPKISYVGECSKVEGVTMYEVAKSLEEKRMCKPISGFPYKIYNPHMQIKYFECGDHYKILTRSYNKAGEFLMSSNSEKKCMLLRKISMLIKDQRKALVDRVFFNDECEKVTKTLSIVSNLTSVQKKEYAKGIIGKTGVWDLVMKDVYTKDGGTFVYARCKYEDYSDKIAHPGIVLKVPKALEEKFLSMKQDQKFTANMIVKDLNDPKYVNGQLREDLSEVENMLYHYGQYL